MTGENHLTYFKVQNFKRFKELEVKDIGQFNLVLGDNNVGKTSFLEALLSFSSKESVDNYISFLYSALRFRNFKNVDVNTFFLYFLNTHSYHEDKKGTISFYFHSGNKGYSPDLILEYDIISKPSLKYKKYVSDVNPSRSFSGIIELKELTNRSLSIPFIPFSTVFSDELTDFYVKNIQSSKLAKERFFESLGALFPNIERVEPTPGSFGSELTLGVEIQDSDYMVPLAFFGEGIIKIARILATIVKFKGSFLLIDEIDTGIHYSRMKDFWKTILLAAKENDVQLFTTTHNLECIRYFKEAMEEVDLVSLQKEARSITLVENSKTKEITAHTFSFEALEHSIEAGNEIRSF
jgi:AAA15 family ATPase/GTPase